MRLSALILFLGFGLTISAQDPTPPSELEGQQLRDWLRTNWYLPWHDQLGYDDARTAMYSTIDVHNGVIEGVYSGFTQPATFNTFPDPINTEHTVPQSFFDGNEPMRSDIHHIYPTHMNANNDRASLPFAEVIDSQTDKWIIGSAGNYSSTGGIPTSNIDDYSEFNTNQAFEPREEKKGNTARAVLYFYTMYPDDLEAAFQDISSVCELSTLYSWHVMDPPDAEEIARDQAIQDLQGNYNPYIHSPELVAPAWDIVSGLEELTVEFQVVTDANRNEIRIISLGLDLRASLYNCMGQELIAPTRGLRLSTAGIATGVYLVSVVDKDGRRGTERVFVR